MLKFLVSSKAPKILLVEKTDRLYRNFKDYVAMEDLIRDHALQIHLVKESEVLSTDARSHVKFIHGIKLLMAKNYIDNLSEEVKKGHRQKVIGGGWITLAPYGYQNNRMDKTIEIELKEAPFVIRAFQLYASGLYSLDACRFQLEHEGFIYRPYASRISTSKLHTMLQSRFYAGQLEFNGEVFQGQHPPLIGLSCVNY